MPGVNKLSVHGDRVPQSLVPRRTDKPKPQTKTGLEPSSAGEILCRQTALRSAVRVQRIALEPRLRPRSCQGGDAILPLCRSFPTCSVTPAR